MSTFVAIEYEDPHRALEVRTALAKLQREYLIDLEDAVVAVKNEQGEIKLHQAVNLTAAGAVSGGFWGSLIGLLFMNPLLVAAVGASAGAVSGALTDVGINNDFMKQLAEGLQPNTSVLFVLVRKATPDKVVEEIKPYGGTVLQTSLSHEDEGKLQAALDESKQANS
ncbi:MAG: DUF1269 domain-containing protein [Planctomycetales bacterium]